MINDDDDDDDDDKLRSVFHLHAPLCVYSVRAWKVTNEE